MTPLAPAARPMTLADELGHRIERMIAIQAEMYPEHWSEEDRRELAEKTLFGEGRDG